MTDKLEIRRMVAEAIGWKQANSDRWHSPACQADEEHCGSVFPAFEYDNGAALKALIDFCAGVFDFVIGSNPDRSFRCVLYITRAPNDPLFKNRHRKRSATGKVAETIALACCYAIIAAVDKKRAILAARPNAQHSKEETNV